MAAVALTSRVGLVYLAGIDDVDDMNAEVNQLGGLEQPSFSKYLLLAVVEAQDFHVCDGFLQVGHDQDNIDPRPIVHLATGLTGQG